MRILYVSVLTCALLGGGEPVFAQDTAPPEETGRFRLGPVRLTPTVHITNFGIDTNVFNEFEDPKEDVTAAVGPALDLWMRFGRARLTAKGGLDYNYFNEYDSQRYVGTSSAARVSLQLARLAPFVEGGYTSTRQRPGYEIDVRAERTLGEVRAGTDLRLGGRTLLTIAGAWQQYRFASDEQFLGAQLSEALDNDSRRAELTLARQLTPLTTFVVTAEQRQDRFLYATVRDTDAFKIVSGFDLKPFALVSGNIRVGWRQFDTLEAFVPDYSGLIAAGELGYVLRTTRVEFRVKRDIEYSFQEFQPYYLLTDLQLEVTQRITNRWDVVGRAARQSLDYRVVALADGGGRLDAGRRLGGGLGYWFGEHIRLGIDVNRDRRTSDVALRTYDAWRVGGSLSYGIEAR